jgi:cellulose biosynthesis protein BcsQ
MKTVAIFNLKGGVGKTTTAVNLSYLAAASGQRTLLWDLDPQAASTYAFRIRPEVSGIGKRSLDPGQALCDAIKQTDYAGLCLLPADFAYRKFDRLLASVDDPARLLASLLDTIGRDFDVVFLDCPAGFSRLAEAIVTTADGILVPTVPTVLSLRMVSRLVSQMAHCRSHAMLAAVLSMVDRRKTLHRRARELASMQPGIFLTADIPYASVVEQMAARRMPIHAFAAHETAAAAFTETWAELQVRLQRTGNGFAEREWNETLERIESLIEQLQSPERPVQAPKAASAGGNVLHERSVDIVHRFDTDQRDLERRGHVLELRERSDGSFVVAARVAISGGGANAGRVEARIDRSWTVRILAGELSPVEALAHRAAWPQTGVLEHVRAAAGGRQLERVDTRHSTHATLEPLASCGLESTAPNRQAVGY